MLSVHYYVSLPRIALGLCLFVLPPVSKIPQKVMDGFQSKSLWEGGPWPNEDMKFDFGGNLVSFYCNSSFFRAIVRD